MNHHSKKGFTLIEVLVVVAIIAILSAVVYASFSGARITAKNKALRASLSEVQLALEVYKAQNKSYPANLNLLVPQFISTLPKNADSADPSNCRVEDGGSTYDAYQSDGTYYKLTARNCFAGATSAATGVKPDDEFARCPTTCGGAGVCSPSTPEFYQSMAVYSKGGECL